MLSTNNCISALSQSLFIGNCLNVAKELIAVCCLYSAPAMNLQLKNFNKTALQM